MNDRTWTWLKLGAALVAVFAQAAAGPAAAFCGFYVAQADSKLFNKSSKVVLARDGNETAITMASDYEGEAREFAVVIPVPTFIERKQIGVVEFPEIIGQQRGLFQLSGGCRNVLRRYCETPHRAKYS